MRSAIPKGLVLVGACLMFGGSLWGQENSPGSRPRVEVAIAYDSLLSNVVRSNRFWMQGGSIQLAGEFWHGLGVEADISGLHTQNANNT
jgi:hypothetical protein